MGKQHSGNTFYSVKYDGDILLYKTKRSFGLLIGVFGFIRRIEVPLNITVGFKYRNYWFYGALTLQLYHHSGQSNSRLKSRKCKLFLWRWDRMNMLLIKEVLNVLLLNLKGKNIGVMPVRDEAIALADSMLASNHLQENTPRNLIKELQSNKNYSFGPFYRYKPRPNEMNSQGMIA